MLVEAMTFTFAQRTGGADTGRNLPAGADAAATDRLVMATTEVVTLPVHVQIG